MSLKCIKITAYLLLSKRGHTNQEDWNCSVNPLNVTQGCGLKFDLHSERRLKRRILRLLFPFSGASEDEDRKQKCWLSRLYWGKKVFFFFFNGVGFAVLGWGVGVESGWEGIS